MTNKGIEMKQSWTMYIYKQDRRCKRTGTRLFSTTVWTDRDEAGMQREVVELHQSLYPKAQFHILFYPHLVWATHNELTVDKGIV